MKRLFFVDHSMRSILLFFCFMGISFSSFAADCCEIHASSRLYQERQRLIECLNQKNTGAQVIADGDTITVILSVDRFFKFPTDTRTFISKNAVLDDVARLLLTYGRHPILVSGHTDEVGTDEAKLYRSREQAKTIAGYLWSGGIRLENLSTLGCGDTEPVSSNTTARGSAANRRIEITLEYAQKRYR